MSATTYYFEFIDGNNFLYYVSPEQYLSNPSSFSDIKGIPISTWQKANRVWKETDSSVSLTSHDYPIDMKEFMWIKLKAQKLEKYNENINNRA